LLSAVDKLTGELGEPPRASSIKRAPNRDGIYARANDVDTPLVLGWLGIEHDEKLAKCVGCSEDGALICADGGIKCLHDRCAAAGPAAHPGFRTNVDIVAHVQNCDPAVAARRICDQFASPIEADDTSAPTSWLDDTEQPDSSEQPTAEQPLRGLRHLGAVAVVGRERILELASKPIEYVWVDIAPPGIVTLIAGPPADGKTTLLFLIFGARANLETPITLLDREVRPAPPGQYLVLIEGEHSEASTARKLVRSLRLLAVDDVALERIIIIARKAVKLGSPEWQEVVQLVRVGLVSDIGIDTVARIAYGDSDSEREQVAIFEGVAQAIESAPAGVLPPNIWAVAHTRKNNTTGELADVSGSVQRVGQSDSVLLMKAERVDGRVVSTRVVFAKLREDPDEYPEPAEIVIANGVLTTGATPNVTDDRPLETRILDALASGPKTKSALSGLLKRNKLDLERAITALFGVRAIESTTVTIRGRDYPGFRARTAARLTPDCTPDSHYAGPTPDSTPDEAEPC
jgi:hypothetical protein